MTESEKLLETILANKKITFEKIPEGEVKFLKTPDYLVMLNSTKTYWEVKELKENPSEKSILNSDEIYSVNSIRVSNNIKDACNSLLQFWLLVCSRILTAT